MDNSKLLSFTLPNGIRVFADSYGDANPNQSGNGWASIDICCEYPDGDIETICAVDYDVDDGMLQVAAFDGIDDEPAYVCDDFLFAYPDEDDDDEDEAPLGTKFYRFIQNNSGGFFIVDENLCATIYIEADNIAEAIKKAEEVGCYWDGVSKDLDCSCCGDRWYPDADVITADVMTNAMQYSSAIGHWTTPDVRIFYKNGNIGEITVKK